VDVLAAIDERNPDLNAFTEVFHNAAPATTEGALAGRPIAIKDNICTREGHTRCGSRLLEDYRSPYDATVVERLHAAGAVIIGKTNMDEFGMGSSTEHSAFGPTRNPHDRSRVPGGSSGGSASAVAAGLAFAALGSDTGGSVRQPASFCGVVGVRPTWGRVSRFGLVAFASSFDQIGPIARTVEDAAQVLNVIAGPDARDATSRNVPVLDYAKALHRGLDGLTIGVPWDFLQTGLDGAVAENFDVLVKNLESRGVGVRRGEVAHAHVGRSAYEQHANAEASANLARFDGVRYGRRAAGRRKFEDMVALSRGEGFGAEVKRRILLGTFALSAGYHDAWYQRARRVRAIAAAEFDAAFDTCDLVLTPTTPTPAFELGEKVDDPISMYLSDILTIPASLAGLPAVTVPSGTSAGGLPLGVQLVGRAFDEATVLRAAAGIERMCGNG
jgi:aspartyl-tRNA(Asn)/glutamyl-tRNA(Gln) amidotransferase subunit A